MVTTYAGFHLVCCHFDHYTRAHNVEKLCVIKYPELNKFCMPAKLKLIEHFAHVTLVTPKYSQSMVVVTYMYYMAKYGKQHLNIDLKALLTLLSCRAAA